MKLQRDWITPLVIGAFGLIAVTGLLMFFHLDTGLNKVAHEWLSWLLVAGVAGHAAVNWAAFRRHLQGARGRVLVGACALLLGLSFAPLGGGDEPPFLPPLKALAAAPLSTVAQVARISPDELRARLAQAGVHAERDGQTLQELVGTDTRRQVQVLGRLFAPAAGG